ncbi:methylenetetrahydrofolate dehydrogenase [NAD(+)]-like [Tetranychus urticae]|uniref:methylenetetrahydrofolate dehydrogenase [NAD(+)]-like n=1 Tax=Tetranychus urticae TaxID=32264 RepID=UPI00077B8531|nr:methylenetetrahydrofolate dehydrogenase [NAD(+)]-like [Tetranychus urticae]
MKAVKNKDFRRVFTTFPQVVSITVKPPIIDDLKEWIDQSRARPRLVGFLANKDQSAITYAKWTQRSCEEIGIKFELRQVEREDLEEGIIEANEDRRVDGVMVYYPVFGGGHDQYIQNCVSPFKDVEGLCHNILNHFLTDPWCL